MTSPTTGAATPEWRRHLGRAPTPRNDSHRTLARHLIWASAMSQPRQITAGATYLISRRTLRRHYLFRPDATITQLIVYALAVSARRFGLEVHAFCAMSTHLHLVVTDVHA